MKIIRHKVLAQRYALALYEIADSSGLLEEVFEDMQLVDRVNIENPELKRVWISPIIPPSKKRNILIALLKDKINDISLTFLTLVTDKAREIILHEIVLSFIEIYGQIHNINELRIKVAAPINEENKARIIEKLKPVIKGTIELEVEVDPRLIGGFQLFFDDYLYDASLLKQLKELKKEFSENLFVTQF